MFNRIIGVLSLNAKTFEEIEGDESAITQAAIIVAAVAIIGGVVGGAIATFGGGSFIKVLIGGIINAFLGWVVWAGVTQLVGTKVFGGNATFMEMLRVLGFAQAPGILGIIPIIGGFIGLIWSAAAGFIAVRQGLDLDNTKAILTIIIAFVVNAIVISVVNGIFR